MNLSEHMTNEKELINEELNDNLFDSSICTLKKYESKTNYIHEFKVE